MCVAAVWDEVFFSFLTNTHTLLLMIMLSGDDDVSYNLCTLFRCGGDHTRFCKAGERKDRERGSNG